jgi:hypothetical protein
MEIRVSYYVIRMASGVRDNDAKRPGKCNAGDPHTVSFGGNFLNVSCTVACFF